MSVSPQPAPQPPPLSRSPQLLAAPAPTGSPLPHAAPGSPQDSPAQLASLLSSSLHETESLKRELKDTRRRAEKAERLLSSYQKQSPAATDAPAEPQDENSYIAELEARAARLLAEKEELEARLTRLQENWIDCEHYIAEAETAAANARISFSNIMASRGGVLVSKNGPPPYAVAFPHTKQGLSQTSSHPTSSSRVRPRSGSLDGSAYALTGPGGPPPAKRARNDRDHEPSRYSPNGHAEHSPSLQHPIPADSPYVHAHPSYRRGRDGEPVIRYTDAQGQSSRLPHRGRREHRDTSRSRSRSRSRSSIDEMILEATTGEDIDANGNPITRVPGQQHLSPNPHLHSRRHRSLSNEREYLAVPHHHSRSRGSSHHSLHPSMSGSTVLPGGVPQGPGVPGNALTHHNTIQTHIFAPPVTGAPVKKTSTAGQIPGTTSIASGGYPPTNSAGQRICRQCGQPGRYKDGKCVEKWGPGPEGPGTVCDRCRKKMKRVERRGTLDAQQLAANHGPAAVHPSAAALQHPPTNGRSMHISSQDSSRSIHRTDTLPAHQMSGRALGPSGTQIIPSGSYVYHESRTRPGSPAHPVDVHSQRLTQRSPPTPPPISTMQNSSSQEADDAAYELERAASRSKRGSRMPTPRVDSPEPVSRPVTNGHTPAPTTQNGGSPRSPPEVSAPSQGAASVHKHRANAMEVDQDADGDADADAEADAEAEPDADADADADAEAELLEAVDAAEANNASSGEEWLKKEES